MKDFQKELDKLHSKLDALQLKLDNLNKEPARKKIENTENDLIGKVGYFWDNEAIQTCTCSVLGEIYSNQVLKYLTKYGTPYKNFSIEPPKFITDEE